MTFYLIKRVYIKAVLHLENGFYNLKINNDFYMKNKSLWLTDMQ